VACHNAKGLYSRDYRGRNADNTEKSLQLPH
jgi:hypothetical protein